MAIWQNWCFGSILSFKNWSFANCWAFGSRHFCVRKKAEIIERKFKNTKSEPQQHLSLAKLTEERFELRDSAAQLSEKYEDLRDNEGNLVARIEAVLNAIQRSSSSHDSRFLNLWIYKNISRNFLCFVFLQGKSFQLR